VSSDCAEDYPLECVEGGCQTDGCYWAVRPDVMSPATHGKLRRASLAPTAYGAAARCPGGCELLGFMLLCGA
jgi:hypothetical protein